MTPVTKGDVVRMIRSIETAHDRVARYVAPYGNLPSEGSLAAAELRTFSREESVRTAYSQGISLVEVAADQLMAFSKTVTEPVQSIAPWTCIRALLEASALACWLFDPKVDVRVRVHRSLTFHYEGLSQQLKWAHATGPEVDATRVLSRLVQVEAVAVQLGFVSEQKQKSKGSGVGARMPSVTDIIRTELHEEATRIEQDSGGLE